MKSSKTFLGSFLYNVWLLFTGRFFVFKKHEQLNLPSYSDLHCKPRINCVPLRNVKG